MIKEITLDGYGRFFLNHIEKITYTPKQKLQLILGSNGSGKSSLLSELNELPINKNDFNENGYKEIIREKDGSVFKIKSTVSKNSFIKDGIELNTGGTKKVQLNLIKEYFNLTPRYNNVVLGIDKLTNMSTNDRKQFLREMSTVDYAYGIYLYNSLKQQLRDTVGYLKVVQIELNNDVTTLLSDEEIDILKKEISEIKDIIDSLSMSYQKSENYKDINPIDISKLDFSNMLDVNKLEYMLSTKIELLKSINDEMDILNSEIDSLDNYNRTSEDSEILKNSISTLEMYFDELKNNYPNNDFINKNNIKEKLDNFKNIFDVITNNIIEMSYLDGLEFTSEDFKNLTKKKEELSNNYGIHKTSFNNYSKELEIMLSNKTEDNKIACSSCGTVNYYGYNETRENILNKKLSEMEPKLKKLEVELKEVEELYFKQKSKIEYLLNIKNTLYGANVLEIYNGYMKEYSENLLSVSSVVLNIVMKKIETTLVDFLDYEENLKMYNSFSYKLKLDNEVMEMHKKKNKEDKEKLLEKLDTLLNKKRTTLSEIDDFKNNIIKAKSLESTFKKMKEDIEIHKFNRKQLVINNKNKIISESIKELKTLLITLEDKYNDIEKKKSRIDANKQLIERYEEERIALSYGVNALSPTEGLIAKSINSFINVFLNEMNTIINSVWSYDITLLPCKVNEDNDLDYLFAVRVDNKKTIDDVKMLSSSMRDIVDLSFKIVFMKYMNLTHMPLVLDEFGVYMDDVHRDKVYHVIENVLSNNFSQIFFTANFKSIYGRFADSDIIILDDKNLELEGLTYNENIKIEKK